jgi:hypothetical protein
MAVPLLLSTGVVYVRQVLGPLLVANGTVDAPSLTFASDPDTGLWWDTANTINFATGGVQRAVIDENGNVNLSGILTTPALVLGASIFNSTARTGELSIGNDALVNEVSGTNMAIGFQAMEQNLSGNANLAIGYRALRANQISDDNVALGFFALEQATSPTNVAVGYRALEFLTTGGSNVALGSHAGRGTVEENAPVTDTNGIMIGYISGRSVGSGTTLTNYIGIGYGTLIDKSNQVKIGNTSITESNLYGTLKVTDSLTRTVLSGDEFSLVVDGIASLGATAEGMVIVLDASLRASAQFMLRGAAGEVAIIVDPAGAFTTTEDNAGTRNVYWSAGNARYELQNKTVATRVFRVIVLGKP